MFDVAAYLCSWLHENIEVRAPFTHPLLTVGRTANSVPIHTVLLDIFVGLASIGVVILVAKFALANGQPITHAELVKRIDRLK